MSALDSAALLIEHGNVWVGDDDASAVDLGAVRNVRFTGMQVRSRVESDNRGTVINRGRLQGKIELDWMEPGNAAKLAEVFKGLVSRTTVAGSIVNNHQQVVAAGAWAYNKFIPFDHQNGDGTLPNVDSVVAGTDGALVSETDYFKGRNATGVWGIYVKDSATVTTLNQTITIQFDYTPAAAQVLTGGTNQTATPRYIKIVGPSEDDENVTRTIVLAEATVTSDMLLPFVDVEQANDVGVMPVVAESNKGTEWELTDEINPT